MSGSDLIAALAVYDDAALETLANKGLVRRALKDVDAGKVAVVQLGAASATITADDETVEIDAKGPKLARCTCPAKDVCRHKIAAVVVLRGAAKAPPVGPPAAAPGVASSVATPAVVPIPPPPAADPLGHVLALDLAAVHRWAGKASLRAALEQIDGAAPSITVEGPALVVRFGDGELDVRILAGQGLDGIVSKASAARRKALHTAAVLAVRRANGLSVEHPDPSAARDQPAVANSVEARDPAFHAAIRAALEDGARTALNQAPLALEDRLFELSVSSRTDGLPRLAGTLREISALVRAKRERRFDLVPAVLLSRLAQAYALNDALDGPTPAASLGALEGDVRQTYAAAGPLTLDGLGANLWRTKAGARGVTGYFYAREQGRIVTATLARGSAHDVGFDPVLAYGRDVVWNAAPLDLLLRSTVILPNASMSGDGRISLSSEHWAVAVNAVPTREAADAWPVTIVNWAALQEVVRERFDGALAARVASGGAVLLAPAAHARVSFDATLQEYTWPLADRHGAWIGLTLMHAEADELMGARLQRLATIADVILVLALPRLEAERLTLVPTAVIAATPANPKPHLINVQMPTSGLGLPSAMMKAAWMEQLAKSGLGAPPVDRVLVPALASSATRQNLIAIADYLLAIAELGGRPLADRLARSLAREAAKSDRMGLFIVSDMIGRLTRAAIPGPCDLLRAIHVLDRALALTRPLPWLRFSPGS